MEVEVKKSTLNENLRDTITKKFLKKIPFVANLKISDKFYHISNNYDFYFELKINNHTLYLHLHTCDLKDVFKNFSGHLEDFEMNFVEDYKNNDVQGYFIMDQLIAKEAYFNDRTITGIGYNTGSVDYHLQDQFNVNTNIRKQSIKKRVQLVEEYLVSNNIPITIRSNLTF